MVLRFWQLVKGIDLVDEGLQLAAGEERQEIPLEALDRRRALRRGAQLVRHTEELQALRVQRLEIDLAFHAAVEVADGGEASLVSHRADAFGEHRAADIVHDQIHAFAVGRLHHGIVEVGLAALNRHVEAERLELLQLFGRAGGADHPGA